MFPGNLFLTVVALALTAAYGRLDAPQDVTRRDQALCQEQQYILFFNLDISIVDSGGQCTTSDLDLVASMLQDVYDNLEVEIPVYENESMNAVVCQVPVLGNDYDYEYTYKVGGKFTRCGDYQGQRSLKVNVDSVCGLAEKATYDAGIVAETTRQASVTLRQQNNQAAKCGNKARKAIKALKVTMKAIRKAKRESKLQEKTANELCEQAKSATSDTSLTNSLQQAQAASNKATNAAATAQSALSQMQATDVCTSGSGGNAQNRGDVTIDNLSDMWLTKVAYKLNDKTDESVTAAFNLATGFGPGCFNQWIIKVKIFAVESLGYLTLEDRASWISSAKDCAKLKVQ